ncbi:unnamed protein product (mitochondrion) [Plasmodiophora brassicae]|uniref:ATP-dependent RNA helicase n=1 Tax=Plasmodiophora brassicae TaxID=37360 RepID=A0A3P3Y5M4_PLABS|nr:unnamed protein product [Plasmodiophora brassicae]
MLSVRGVLRWAHRAEAMPAPERRAPARTMVEVPFDTLGLSHETSRAIEAMKWTFMTPFQARTLPVLLAGHDLLCRAQPGAGRTSTFLIPAIETVINLGTANARNVTALIIAPSRDIAMKVAKLAEQLSKYHKINIVNLLGGNDITPEARRLASPVPIDLLIATPSRMKAHLMQTLGFASRLKDLRYLAVADGDRILRESLEKDVVKILGYLPDKKYRQSVLFTDFLPVPLHNIAQLVLRPVHHYIDTVGTDIAKEAVKVEQQVITVPFENHIAALEAAIKEHMEAYPDNFKILVFFVTSRNASYYAKLFVKAGYPVLELHSRMGQQKKIAMSNNFKDAQNVMLFTSDTVVDKTKYPRVTLVIQVGITSKDGYLHRLGQSSAAGVPAKSMLLLAPFEMGLVRELKGVPIEDLSHLSPIVKAEPSSNLFSSLSSVVSDEILYDAAERAYIGFLAHYCANLKRCGWTKGDLVHYANKYAVLLGLKEIPIIQKPMLAHIGLRGVKGLRFAT